MLPTEDHYGSALPKMPPIPQALRADAATPSEDSRPQGVLVKVDGNAKVVDLNQIFDEGSFKDPIDHEIMSEPLMLFSSSKDCGHVLDKRSIAALALRAKNEAKNVLCPICRAPVDRYAPDLTMKNNITVWKKLTGYKGEQESGVGIPKNVETHKVVEAAKAQEIDINDYSLPDQLRQTILEMINAGGKDNHIRIIEILILANSGPESPERTSINALLNAILDGKVLKKRSLEHEEQEDRPHTKRKLEPTSQECRESATPQSNVALITSPPRNPAIGFGYLAQGPVPLVAPPGYHPMTRPAYPLPYATSLGSPQYLTPPHHTHIQPPPISRTNPPTFKEPQGSLSNPIRFTWPTFFFQHWNLLSQEIKSRFAFTVEDISNPPLDKVSTTVELLLKSELPLHDRQVLTVIRAVVTRLKEGLTSQPSRPIAIQIYDPSQHQERLLQVPQQVPGSPSSYTPKPAASYAMPNSSRTQNPSPMELDLLRQIEEQRKMAKIIEDDLQTRSREHKEKMKRALESFSELSKTVRHLREGLIKQERELLDQGVPNDVLAHPCSPFSNPNSPALRSPGMYNSPATPTLQPPYTPTQPPIEAASESINGIPSISIISDRSYLTPSNLIESLSGDYEVAQIKAQFIRYKWNINEVINGTTALHVALEKEKSYQFIKWMCENGADPRITNSAGETPIHVAIRLRLFNHLKQMILHTEPKYFDITIFSDELLKKLPTDVKTILSNIEKQRS